MRRESARTLYTLSQRYQQNISESDYQVIIIDNGSSLPLDEEFVKGFGPNFEYHYFDTTSPSPTAAVNFGVTLAKGQYIGCIVDGARMVTPQIIHYSLLACKDAQCPYITTLAWHLGPKEQNHSVLEGYNQTVEDELLDSINWRDHGYRLFEIAALAGSSHMGLLAGLPYESSFFVMEKSAFIELGGFDQRFQSAGGGLVNHDFLQRVVASKKFHYTVLLGEGSFHQFHGGVATNVQPDQHPYEAFKEEYQSIHGQPFQIHNQPQEMTIDYLGAMPKSALAFVATGK